jgi:putative transposase
MEILTGNLRDYIQMEIIRYSGYFEAELIELNIQPDHVHILVSLPPKENVADYIEYIKFKTSFNAFRRWPALRSSIGNGKHFWAKGYFVSTVGVHNDTVRKYIEMQSEKLVFITE